MIVQKQGCLYYHFDHETVRIEAWGENAVRVRATKNRDFTGNNWALEEIPDKSAHFAAKIHINLDQQAAGVEYANMYSGKNSSYASLKNGKIEAVINADGVLSFYNQNNRLLLTENWMRLRDSKSAPLNVYGREYRGISGDSFRIAVRFESRDGEKIFGMGQYQQKYFDLKGCTLELAQRNSQVSIPFYVSSEGYGFLWNNPAIGQAAFCVNGTQWSAECTKEIDYLVIAGDSPSEIEETYMRRSGLPPMMPEYGMGFWQCKLRYQTQIQLMQVARRYREEGIQLDVIIADFFHWTQQGEYCFDETYWPDVKGMCRELEEMGTRLMVSVWPTVDYRSEHFKEMMEKGYLVRTEQGVRITMTCFGQEVFYDASNPEARAYVWEKIKENYWDKGARLYWLDVAEPEYTAYDFTNYRYHLGSVEEVGNIYPKLYLKGFYDGMRSEGDTMPLSLIRSAWAGSAKYGALVWSGDIVSTFECFNRQVRAGLSMAMAGIPWWTTDIGGFHGGNPDDPKFRELMIRWLEYSCFCPVFRLHGNREPQSGFEGDRGIYYKDSKAAGVFSELQKSLKNVHMDQSVGPVWNYLDYNGVNYLYSNYAKGDKMRGCVIRLDDFLSSIYVNSLGYEGIPFLVKEDGTIMTQSVFDGLYPYESLLESNHTELRSFDFPGIKNMKIHLFITRDSSVLEKILRLQMTLVAAAVALILGCMAGIFLYYRRILLPMNKFVSGLKNMGEEQWIHEFEENNILELEMASKEFRGFLRKIKNLRIEVYEKELASQRIQLEYVQEQIKPHFYLNCLNLIKTMAVSHGTEDISEMTEMLSGCMRYVIKDSSETRKLEDEIAFLYNYVRIQQLRFGRQAFSFEVIMEESIKEMQIPALFLQTFVENSIIHAVTLDKKIEITLYLVIEKIEGQNRLYICISDTGQGFEEETLEALLKDRPIIYENRKHIGIQNAMKRLSMIYGSIASIKLSNMTKEGGAVVEIILPVDNEGNHGSIKNL